MKSFLVIWWSDMKRKVISLMATVLLLGTVAWAQEPAPAGSPVGAAPPPGPPLNVKAVDTPNDNGCSITVTWQISSDDGQGQNSVIGYRILRAESPAGPFLDRGMVPSGATEKNDAGVKDKNDPAYFPRYHDFYYKVAAVGSGGETESPVVGPVQSRPQWFNKDKSGLAVGVVIFTALILVFIRLAKKGTQLYIRPLAGIDAVDEAIGRATEMGKPILYVMGLGTAADIATIASFTILSRVAKKVAEYRTSLIVPCYDPLVMTVAQETVRTSYYDAGRPDAYNQDMVFFLTNYQFAYVGGVNGIMLRQLPATNFYLGKFYAESLLLAETGAVAGSIQIAGTDEVTQIPFFVVACDYTLIGEELYAASAYLGREPILLGSLKAQDWGKAIIIFSVIIGFLLFLLASQGWLMKWAPAFAKLFDVGA